MHTCTSHLGANKAHNWTVEQLADLLRTTTKVKSFICGPEPGGDTELGTYFADGMGHVPLVMDLCITYERFGNRSNPTLNETLHYPGLSDIGNPLNEAVADKICNYRAD